MFKRFLRLVTSPQVVIDSVNLATVFGELDDFSEDELSLCIEDIINFHIDMHLGRGRFRRLRFFLDAQGLSVFVELHHAEALRVVDVVAEDRCQPMLLGVLHALFQQSCET